jgi:hypothetical protein
VRSRFRGLILLSVVLATLVAGCGDDGEDSSRDVTRPSVTSTSPHSPVDPRDSGDTGDTALGPGPEVVQFEAPTEIACPSDRAMVEVSYTTRDVTAIGFAVDGASVSGPAAPISGTYDISLPCDGRVHTIMLVGSGAGAPVFATKAVATRPT